MSRQPFWAIECLDLVEAELLLDVVPMGSWIECRGPLVIVWVPVPPSMLPEQNLAEAV